MENGNGMEPAHGQVLVVDDEESVCEVLGVILRKEGHEVTTVTDPVKALELADRTPFDLVIQDLKMPGMDGIDLLKKIRERNPQALVVVMTAFSSWDRAVEAMRLGAYNYIRKPFDNNDIKALVSRAVELRRTLGREGGGEGREVAPFGNMIGNSPVVRALHDLIRRAGPTDSTILISGESGVGKELVARSIHYGSLRRDQPFITINCGAFTESLLESELFGHVRGSFTGAVADKVGLLEVADRGTFFMDEIAEMSLTLQVKLLRVLEEREFKPVGSTRTKKVDIRFIAATNRNLPAEVKRGTFREDLFYRVNVIPFAVPPLRERREDIPLLAGFFLSRFSQSMRKSARKFSPEAMRWLEANPWAGNVRELENTIQRAVALSDAELIDVRDLVQTFAPVSPDPVAATSDGTSGAPSVGGVLPEGGVDLEGHLSAIEKDFIRKAVRRTGGHLTRAADLLKISFRSLRYKIQKYGLQSEESGGPPAGDPDDGDGRGGTA